MYSLNTCLIMNVAYLKVTFFFLGAGLLMSFHGHLRSAAKMMCVSGGGLGHTLVASPFNI